MSKTILITGGAGFIGVHLARACLKEGFFVRILDNFSPQVHHEKKLPADLINEVELFEGDIRDRSLLEKSLLDVNVIVHLAAETGTGQSMYEINRYFDVNVQGTALLLELLQNNADGGSVQSLIVASSRAVYGEGAYICPLHGPQFPGQRSSFQMARGVFDFSCPNCGSALKVGLTNEYAPKSPASFYGLTKQVQEESVLLYARTRGINAFALRYQNVFGPGQSLKNPYTGILAVFSNLARQNQEIDIFEDGMESRDFVYIQDVVNATKAAIMYESKYVGAVNVGSGRAVTVLEVAESIIGYFNSTSRINISGRYRIGDIRHSVADTTHLESLLNLSINTEFMEGLAVFLEWAKRQPAETKGAYLHSLSELREKGLIGDSSNFSHFS